MEIKKFNPNTTFFTSDLHFCHNNIINYCNRPFNSIEEMNETLINNWNNVVGKDDDVFDLGDFCWGGSNFWHGILPRLNGNHYLILGNHDRQNFRPGYSQYFKNVSMQMVIKVGNQTIYLNHLPFLTWDGCANRNNIIWQLHGHVHLSKFKNEGYDFEKMQQYSLPTQYDVGVDLNNFTPLKFTDIANKIKFQIEHNKNSTYWTNHELY